MGVRDAIDIVLGHMDGAVDDEAGDVDVIIGGVEQRVAFDVDLDQAGSVDLFVQHAIGVDQKLIRGSRHPAGDMVGDHLGHAVQRRQTIAGRKIDPGLPFLGADLFANRVHDLDRGRADGWIHGVSPEICGRTRADR
jgi:hypothetical protein